LNSARNNNNYIKDKMPAAKGKGGKGGKVGAGKSKKSP
jgi:hypothetical protein